jgi:hypothetical protein
MAFFIFGWFFLRFCFFGCVFFFWFGFEQRKAFGKETSFSQQNKVEKKRELRKLGAFFSLFSLFKKTTQKKRRERLFLRTQCNRFFGLRKKKQQQKKSWAPFECAEIWSRIEFLLLLKNSNKKKRVLDFFSKRKRTDERQSHSCEQKKK